MNPRELDPDAYIDRIRKVLKKPDSEAERFRRTQFLRKADAWLAGHAASVGGEQRVVLLHVRVMGALKDWTRVVASVRSKVWKGRKIQSRALLEAAAAHTGLQEFASAIRCLDKALELDPGLAARVDKARRKLEEQQRMDLYGRLSAHVYDAVRSRQAEAAAHLYMSASHIWGMPDQVAKEGGGVLAELQPGRDGGARRGERPATVASDACRLIMTCGSGYSGTGAVTAYLREFEGLPMPFGSRELAVLKKNYGLSRLLANWHDWGREERTSGLQQMVLQAILGVPCYEDSASVDRLYTRSITVNSLFTGETLDQSLAAALGAISRDFIDEAKNAASTRELERASARLVNGVLRLKGGPIALLNNCIHQTQIGMCGLLENSRVIVIKRDPRDQYVAHQTETPGKGVAVEAFIKKRKRADAAVRRYIESGATNVRVFGFEDFVTMADVREGVREWAGVASLSRGADNRFFFPEKSAKNVGIHGKWKNRSDIEMIERQLKDELVGP